MPQTDGSFAFDAATTVRRAEGGGLITELAPGWDVGGGILTAVMIREADHHGSSLAVDREGGPEMVREDGR